MSDIKVLNVIDSLYAGGAEALLKNFVLSAKNNAGFQIDVCTLYSRSVFKEELISCGVNVYELRLKHKYDFSKITRLIKLIKLNSYDIVHVHLFPADLLCSIASLFLPGKVKFIFSEHNVFNRRRSLLFYKPIDKFVYSHYSKVICVSNMVKQSLNDYILETKDKSVVIKNAVPVRFVPDSQEKNYDLLFVGRLEEAKGVDILVQAVKLYRDEYHDSIKMAIVGDGSKKEILFEMVNMFGLGEDIFFLGVRKDIPELMWQSKVLVLPSRWEGLPMVILEAMANKIPVITTPVGGIPEIIENYKTGLLFNPEDAKDLSEKIRLLLSDIGLQFDIKQNAFRKVMDDYSIESYTEEVLKLYREIAFNRYGKR